MPSSLSRFGWFLRRSFRKIRVRVTVFALFGLATAAAAYLLKDFIPDDLSAKVGADAVGSILNVLASSMLTVTTFSLSILTAAYANAAGNSSPRAVALLVEDGFSQTVLATFVGAFVFSIVGISLLPTGVYGVSGRLILFGATLLVVLVVVTQLLRWISNLMDLGRVGDNLSRVEQAAKDSLKALRSDPTHGGQPLLLEPPVDAVPIHAEEIGFIQYIGYAELGHFAQKHQVDLFLPALIGDFVTPGEPLLYLRPLPADAETTKEWRDQLLRAYSIEKDRSFDEDPRYGLTILSEVGQRALSPAVNDPGTGVEAIARMTRVLGKWDEVEPEGETTCPRLWVRPINPGELLQLGFAPLARDGAGNFGLQQALQQALLSLARIAPEAFAETAKELSRMALIYSDEAIPVAAQRERLNQLSEQISRVGTGS